VKIPKDVLDRLTMIPESMAPPDYEKILTQGGLVEKLIGASNTPALESVLNAGNIAGQLAQYLGESRN
jgi:hypothetical protein